MTGTITDITAARRDHYPAVASRPSQRRSAEPDDAPRAVRMQLAAPVIRSKGDTSEPHVVGYASVVEEGYEMYDMFGPYTEVVDRGAFDNTLAANPLVEFTLNHNRGGGLPMAHTRNGTLILGPVDDTGLPYDANVDPTRGDVADMLKALERGDLAEASFKFRIVRGQWSPDYMEYRILEVDLNRGDVSAVNFGANPAASSALREQAGAEEVTTQRRSPSDVVPDAEIDYRFAL
jgi:HK97 family phage prohead protease